MSGDSSLSLKWPTLCLLAACAFGLSVALHAKDDAPRVDPNDPTYRLFQLLDSKRGGKLTNFFVLADTYKDSANPDQEFQHVLRVEYDKNRFFGRFRIAVRSVGKLTPEQLKTYTLQQIYDFGDSDQARFEKIEAGPFGVTGDLYLRSVNDGPLGSSSITEAEKSAYQNYVTQYLLPALQKN